jgi:hypothetical protein
MYNRSSREQRNLLLSGEYMDTEMNVGLIVQSRVDPEIGRCRVCGNEFKMHVFVDVALHPGQPNERCLAKICPACIKKTRVKLETTLEQRLIHLQRKMDKLNQTLQGLREVSAATWRETQAYVSSQVEQAADSEVLFNERVAIYDTHTRECEFWEDVPF